MCSHRFLDWCRASGVEHPAVAPALIPSSSSSSSSYRGLVATKPLAPGDVIARVPARLLLSATGSAARDPLLGPLLLRQQPKQQPLSHHQVLIVHLLLEAAKGPQSPWAPYLSELPRAYAVLAAWPPQAAAALQAPHAVRAQRRAAASARADWLGARGLLVQALKRMTTTATTTTTASSSSSWPQWLWALGAVLSRTMHMDSEDRAGCLTPFGDLLNHAAPVGAPWAPDPLEELAGIERSDDEEEEEEKEPIAGDGALEKEQREASATTDTATYVLRTRRHVPVGGEALLSYGRHTNLELLTLYGFLLPSTNPDDRALLPRRHFFREGAAEDDGNKSDDDDDDDDHLAGTYSAPLASHDNGGNKDTTTNNKSNTGWYVHAADGRPSWALFDALQRHAAAAATAAAGASSSPSSPAPPPPPSPLQQAVVVERWLRAACLATLRDLPTPAEEDEAWLSGSGEADAKNAANDDDDDDPLNIGAECMRLAVEWRLQYKRTLLRCVARCDRALAKATKRQEEEEEEATKRAKKPAPPCLPRRGRVIPFGGSKKK